MSAVAIGLFILACGWQVYRLFLPTRAAALRAEGHPQYFGAALAAGYVALLSIFLHAAFMKAEWYPSTIDAVVRLAPKLSDDADEKKAPSGGESKPSIGVVATAQGLLKLGAPPVATTKPPALASATPKPKKPDSYFTVMAVGLWAGLLALILPHLLNAPFLVNERARHLAGLKSAGEVEAALNKALERETSVAITLTTGKVYVGVPDAFDPTSAGEPDWVRIWPLASGYRSKKGHLKLTTSYAEAYDKIESDGPHGLNVDDFQITLPVAHIVSMQSFSLAFYVSHFGGQAESEEESLPQAIGEQPGSEPAPTKPVVVHDSRRAPYPQTPVISDWALRLLKWSFHLLLTATVVVAPFSLIASAALALAALLVISLMSDPADVHLKMLADSACDF